MKNKMNIKWFQRKGPLFFPVSLVGWLIAIAAIGYCVYLFIDIDRHSHSVSDTLMNFVVSSLIVAVAYSIIAFFTSKKKISE
jgi:membrane protein DedA with SNARE-associated domain